MFTPRKVLTSAAVVLVTIGTLTIGAGAVHAQATDDAALDARLERACLRVPNLQLRTGNLITRIGADADTRGSLLWLDTKIADAETNGHEQLATVLTNRREVRAASVDVLTARQTQLDDLVTICTEHGFGL